MNVVAEDIILILVSAIVIKYLFDDGKNKNRRFFHTIGLGCIVVASGMQFWMFYNIRFTGIFAGCEPDIYISTAEFGMSGYGVFYALYLALNWIRKARKGQI